MSELIEPVGSSTCPQLRLISGLEVLEEWSDTASQVKKNAMHKALFAVADRSVFGMYEIIDDIWRPREFYVVVKDDLVVKICLHDFDAFGIVYLGSLDELTDLDLGVAHAA